NPWRPQSFALRQPACHSEEPRSDRDDEESRIVLKTLRARFLAEFTLSGQSEILRCAQDDSEGLGMTSWKGFSAPCEALPFRFRSQTLFLRGKGWCSSTFRTFCGTFGRSKRNT